MQMLNVVLTGGQVCIPDKVKYKIQHDFDAISANKELPSYSNELRENGGLFLVF